MLFHFRLQISRILKAESENGFLLLNPPYGQRLMPDETDALYNMIGSTLKHNFPGTTAWLITSNKESLKHVGLKPKKNIHCLMVHLSASC